MFPCFFNRILFPVIIIASSFKTDAQSTKNVLKNKNVLVYTKNGKGYVHENISSSIAAIQKLGSDLKFKVDTSTNAAIFTDEELKKLLKIGEVISPFLPDNHHTKSFAGCYLKLLTLHYHFLLLSMKTHVHLLHRWV